MARYAAAICTAVSLAAAQPLLQQLDAWCGDALRVRVGVSIVEPVTQGLLYPPSPACAGGASSNSSLTNGNIAATITPSSLTVRRVSDGATVLQSLSWSVAALPGQRDPSGAQLFAARITFARLAGNSEYIYGLGEHKTGNLSYGGGWFHAFEDSETTPRNGDISIPVYHSSLGYAFLWNLPSFGYVSINDTAIEWYSNSTTALDFWVAVPPADWAAPAPPYPFTLAAFANATGFPRAMPTWATGFWQCKLRYRNTTEVMDVAQGYLSRGVPLSVEVIDYYHWQHFGDWSFNMDCYDPEYIMSQFTELSIQLMVSVWPHVEVAGSHYSDMLQRGYFVKNSSGQAVPFTNFNGPLYQYDATNPAARQYVFQALADGYLKYGIKVFWLDADEPQGMQPGQEYFYLGRDLTVGMSYGRFHQQMIHDGLTSVGETDIISLSRSTWTGASRFGGAVWSGDIDSNFTSFIQQIKIAQNVHMSGIYAWTTDIGGFNNGYITDPVFQQLIVRWFQFGAFCSLFRLHGARLPGAPDNACGSSGGPNEIWEFGDTAYPIIAQIVNLREQLRPYILEKWQDAMTYGTPLVRPMVFDFSDPECFAADDQFIFGGDWLVAPVYVYNATSRYVYLPRLASNGTWTYFYDQSRTFVGGQNLSIATPLTEFPLFYITASAAKLPATLITRH